MDEVAELLAVVPEAYRERFVGVVEICDEVCEGYLTDEYRMLCREMAAELCRDFPPILRGAARSWAAGIVYSIGWVNFLGDPNAAPCYNAEELAKCCGVSEATLMSKSRVIRQVFDLMRMDPNWWLPSKIEQNMLAWLVPTEDGLILDAREEPRDFQEAAFEAGLIPFVPTGPS